MPTLKKLLITKDNDYSKLAESFKGKTGVNIIKGYNNILLTRSCSIVIPFYDDSSLVLEKSLISLQYQKLSINSKVEIILINDGSSIDLKKVIQRVRGFYPITYLKLKKNYGRTTARNLGLLYAENDIILFLDADIITPSNFLASHLLRHQFFEKSIIVGFRHDTSFKNPILRLSDIKQKTLQPPIFKNDFRYEKFIPQHWKSIYKDVSIDNFNKKCYLLRESDYFKKFGNGKILGVWDLPFMFLANNASVFRKYVLEVGGFDMKFKGWGVEDVHLAAKLIARGLYLIPNLDATVYHIKNKKDKKKKNKEFKKNFQLYNQLKNKKFQLYSGGEWEEKMTKYFKNKFSIKRF